MTTNAFNKSTAIIAGLVLVPVVIIIGVTFAAINCPRLWEKTSTKIKSLPGPFPWRKKPVGAFLMRRNNDSFGDLESAIQIDKFIGQEDISLKDYSKPIASPTPERIWHPNRSSRLAWSFTSPRSRTRLHCELSNVQKPNPIAVRSGACHRVEELQPLQTLHPILPRSNLPFANYERSGRGC